MKLRLRRPNRDWDFYPFDEVLDMMLHELCHNVHGPHNASFYSSGMNLEREVDTTGILTMAKRIKASCARTPARIGVTAVIDGGGADTSQRMGTEQGNQATLLNVKTECDEDIKQRSSQRATCITK
ncbi:Zinc ion binding isoform 2 [Spatholobus suberectus]|nr:Zinc ion binding isoform 2 [Spatholobus suberectus]